MTLDRKPVPGDLMRLKSGGPTMVVLCSPWAPNNFTVPFQLVWHDAKGALRVHRLPADAALHVLEFVQFKSSLHEAAAAVNRARYEGGIEFGEALDDLATALAGMREE